MIIPKIKYERSYNYHVEDMYKNASEIEILYMIEHSTNNVIWDLIYRFHIQKYQMSDLFLIRTKEKMDWNIVLKYQHISYNVWEKCYTNIEVTDNYKNIKKIIEYILIHYMN